jgi:hypothetical protein
MAASLVVQVREGKRGGKFFAELLVSLAFTSAEIPLVLSFAQLQVASAAGECCAFLQNFCAYYYDPSRDSNLTAGHASAPMICPQRQK